MRAARVVTAVPCMLALAGCFGDEGIDTSAGASTTGTSSSGGETGDEPTGSSSTTGGVASPDCDAYLDCVLEATPDAYGGAVAVYGPSSDCRNSTPQVAEDCARACRAARDDLHETHPDAAACGVDEPATTGDATSHAVSGVVEMVNAPANTSTSVLLVSAASFFPQLLHTVAPMGPGAMDVNGAWSIPDVPNGTYWVLIAFADDKLVPDPNGFAAPSMVVVQGEDVEIGTTKVVAAIVVVSPTGGEVVPGVPSLVWTDQPGEDLYRVHVVNEAGDLVWDTVAPAGVDIDTVAVEYDGPELVDGTYQVRVTAFSKTIALTRTEDLAGIFLVKNL